MGRGSKRVVPLNLPIGGAWRKKLTKTTTFDEKEKDKLIIQKKKELFAGFRKGHEKRLEEEGKPLWFTSFYLKKLKELCFSEEELIELAALIELGMEMGRLQGMADFMAKLNEVKNRKEEEQIGPMIG